MGFAAISFVLWGGLWDFFVFMNTILKPGDFLGPKAHCLAPFPGLTPSNPVSPHLIPSYRFSPRLTPANRVLPALRQ